VEEAYQALRERKVDAYLLILPDFLRTGGMKGFFPFEKGKLPRLFPPRSLDEWLTDNLLQYRGLSLDALKRIKDAFSSAPGYIDVATGEAVNFDTLDFSFKKSIFSLMLYLFVASVILLPSDYLFDSVRDEKRTKLLEILLTSATPMQVLLGKFLSSLVVAFLPFVFWLSMGRFLLKEGLHYFFSTQAPGLTFTGYQVGLVVFYATLGIVFYGALFLAVGLVGNPTVSRRIAKFFRFAMIVPPILTLRPLFLNTDLPQFFKSLSYLPVFTPTTMVLRIETNDLPGLLEVVGTGLLALTAALGFLKLASVLLRRSTVAEGLLQRKWEP